VSVALGACGEAAQLGRASSSPPDPAAVRTANEASAISPARSLEVGDGRLTPEGRQDVERIRNLLRAGDLASRCFLNNGANFVLVNAVQRLPLVGIPQSARSVAALVKAGLGFMVPHAENAVLGESNQAGFQHGGLGAGLEVGLRVHLLRHLFVEAAQKVFYGRYRSSTSPLAVRARTSGPMSPS